MADDTTTIKVSDPKAQRSNNLIADFYYGKVEKTFEESSYNSASQLKPYNPSDIYQKTGDHSLYEEMVKDDQVSCALQLKKDLVLANGFDILCEDEDQQDIKDYLELALNEDPEVPFNESLEEICSAYEFGFSLSEKIFKKRVDGMLTLRAIKTRHPDTWLIYTDKHGNIEKIEQRGVDRDIKINPKSLIHFINKRRFQNPYGVSDLETCYAAYFIKRQIIRYYGMFIEKAAGPVPVAKYPDNMPPEAVTKIFNAIKSFQAKTALAVPKELEIEFLEAKSNGEAFIKGINIFNLFIGRALLLPDLLGMSGSETGGGAFALGKEHMRLFFKHIGRRRLQLERMINSEIIKPLVVYNFGFVDHFPKFKFKPIDETDAIEASKLWLEAVKANAYKPNEEEINHFRSIVNYPEGEVEYPQRPQMPFGQPNMNQPDQTPKAEDNLEKEIDDQIKEKDDKEFECADKKSFTKPYNFPDGDYHKRVDFKALEASIDNTESLIKSEAAPLIDKIIEDLKDQIVKKKIVQNGHVNRVDTIKLKYLKPLKQLLQKHLLDQYKTAQVMAQKEIFKSSFSRPLPTDEFLQALDQENFNFVGDWEYQLTKEARIAAINAVKNGDSLNSVLDIIDESVTKSANISLERYARTKTTEVMNNARRNYFESTNVVAGYQYSAVMDAATTEICSSLNSKIFKLNEAPTPPLHFFCRSVLIPITIYEELKPDSKIGNKDIQDFIKENAGRGFGGRPI